MYGSKPLLTLLFLIFCAVGLGAKRARPLKSSSQLSRAFFSTTLLTWQHQAQINDGSTSLPYNATSLALGVGLGYVNNVGSFSLISQGQMLLGNADVGVLTGAIPNIDVDFSGKGVGFLGGKIDFAFLLRASEGVAWGLGVPFISTFYFKRSLGNGIQLKNQYLVDWGLFMDFRLKRGSTFFNPKIGFIRNLRQYFASMDFHWHF